MIQRKALMNVRVACATLEEDQILWHIPGASPFGNGGIGFSLGSA